MNPLLGISIKILSVFFLTLSAAVVKALTARYPVGEIVFMRSAIGLFPVMAWLAWRGVLRASFRTNRFRNHIWRCVLGLIATYLVFLTLAYLPLPDATAIGYATPIILVALAGLFLNERIGPWRWGAVAAGFVGVLIMLSPHLAGGALAEGSQGSRTGALVGLAAAFALAAAMATTSKLTRTETTGSIVFYFFFLITLMSLVSAPFGWRMPAAEDLLLFGCAGVLGGIGQILLTECYRHADTSVIAGFEYTSMIWAVTLGWAAFGEVPAPAVLVGAAVVAASSIFITLRERRLRARRTGSQQSSRRA